MISVETHSALLQYISSLANQRDSTLDTSLGGKIITTGVTAHTIVLPGPNNADKAILERELAALSTRIKYLEARANIVSNHPYVQVSNWPPSCESGVDQATTRVLAEGQLNYLRSHVDRQADKIENQRERIDNLDADVNERLNDNVVVLERGIEDIDTLKRELCKHQQANLAFQEALREIGNIIAAVAMGDLSKKVLIHAIEMDPEIRNFKRTINEMVDHLQVFAS